MVGALLASMVISVTSVKVEIPVQTEIAYAQSMADYYRSDAQRINIPDVSVALNNIDSARAYLDSTIVSVDNLCYECYGDLDTLSQWYDENQDWINAVNEYYSINETMEGFTWED